MTKTIKTNIIKYSLFFICSAIILLIMSRCSFLYSASDQGDANCFFTSAKLMMNGRVLYNDFYEQKGPIIYFIHILALHIIPNSFHGIYIIETILAFIYCIFIYKTISVFSTFSDTKNIIITIFGCMSSYITGYMCHGDEIEELCLPLFAFLIYHVVKYIKTKESPKIIILLTIGSFIGIIFWSKYTIVLPYVMILLYLVYTSIRNKDYKTLKRVFLYATIGFCIVTSIMLIYFLVTHSFKSMIDVYFIENLFGYRKELSKISNTETTSFISVVLFCLANIECSNFGNVYLILLTILILYSFRHKIKSSNIFYFVVYGYLISWISISLYGIGWSYYYMHISVWFGLILTFFLSILNKKLIYIITPIVASLFILCIVLEADFKQYNYDKKVYEAVEQIVGDRSICFYNSMNTGFTNNYLTDKYYFTVTNGRRSKVIDQNTKAIKNKEYDYVIAVASEDYTPKTFYGYKLIASYTLLQKPDNVICLFEK